MARQQMLTHTTVACGAVVMMVVLNGCGQSRSAGLARVHGQELEQPAAIAADFDVLSGSVWNGQLTYLDYTAKAPRTIRSTLRVEKVKAGWNWATGYNDEPHADSAELVQILDNGAVILSGDTRERVIERSRVNGSTRIVTEHTGTDDGRAATIRRVYELGPKACTITKLVRFQGDEAYFQRNTYAWSR